MHWFETVRPCYRYSQKGRTPLGYACSRGHVKVVQALLSAGANKDTADEVGITLICSFSTLSVNMYWFEVYICPGSAQDGGTPLGYACSRGHVEVVQALLSAGANKETADLVGITLICSFFNIFCTHALV